MTLDEKGLLTARERMKGQQEGRELCLTSGVPPFLAGTNVSVRHSQRPREPTQGKGDGDVQEHTLPQQPILLHRFPLPLHLYLWPSVVCFLINILG